MKVINTTLFIEEISLRFDEIKTLNDKNCVQRNITIYFKQRNFTPPHAINFANDNKYKKERINIHLYPSTNFKHCITNSNE